jgi:hypothetical protein
MRLAYYLSIFFFFLKSVVLRFLTSFFCFEKWKCLLVFFFLKKKCVFGFEKRRLFEKHSLNFLNFSALHAKEAMMVENMDRSSYNFLLEPKIC